MNNTRLLLREKWSENLFDVIKSMKAVLMLCISSPLYRKHPFSRELCIKTIINANNLGAQFENTRNTSPTRIHCKHEQLRNAKLNLFSSQGFLRSLHLLNLFASRERRPVMNKPDEAPKPRYQESSTFGTVL